MHCPPRRSGQLLLLHNSYAILAANPLLLLFRQEFCSSVLRLTFGLVLRNAQMGTAITKGGWEGRREIKKWSISLELFIQNWCKKDSFTLILSQIHYSNLMKSHLGIFPPRLFMKWIKDPKESLSPIQRRATLYKWGHLNSKAKFRFSQDLPDWTTDTELDLPVKADRLYPRRFQSQFTLGAFYLFLASPHGSQGLSLLTRDWILWPWQCKCQVLPNRWATGGSPHWGYF